MVFSRQEYWSKLPFPSPAKSLLSCLTVCNPMDCSPPGSSVHGILQARILEWVAFPSPGDLPDPGIKPRSPTLQADSLPAEPQGKPFAAVAKSLQLCLTLCDPIPGILQARTPEWVAISFSNAWKWKVKVKSLSHVRPSVTPWTAAYQAPPSIGVSRQEYWSGLPLKQILINI